MFSTISTPTTYLPSLFTQKKSTIFSISSSLLLLPQTTNCRLSTSIPPLGLGLVSPWDGLRHSGIPIKLKSTKIERRRKSNNKVVHASLFGVGAPEALVIGVVALLVFGPKGLAEVARNLGKTLRSFQPTIRELQDVSREFKSTLEREIGLDDIPPSVQNTRSSTTSSPSANSQATLDTDGTPLTNRPYSTEDYLKTTKDQLEAMALRQQTSPREQYENQSQDQDDAPPEKPFNLGDLLVEAQIRSKTQDTMVPQEAQSGVEPEPKGSTVPQEAQYEVGPQPEVAPTMSPSKMPENEK